MRRGRVIRGGSCGYTPWFLRSADRFRSEPEYRYWDAGFRVVVRRVRRKP